MSRTVEQLIAATQPKPHAGKHRIFIYNNYHAGDVLTNRCLIRELLKHRDKLEIAVGSFVNNAYLYADFGGKVRNIISIHEEGFGNDLRDMCPVDYIPINSWCGTFPDIDAKGHHNWRTIVDTWNRQAEQHDIDVRLEHDPVPMLDFDVPHSHTRTKLDRISIYVENGRVRSNPCKYEFNMAVLALKYPDFDFYCTGHVECQMDNVLSKKTWNLIHLSHWSNMCHAIIGKGSGPFIATYTEPNRHKPRAVMQFTAPKFWEYPGNPLQYLNTDDELYGFLDSIRSDQEASSENRGVVTR